MILFVSIILLCLLFLVIPKLCKMLQIAQFVRKRSATYSAKLQEKLDVAKEELKRVRALPPTDQYSYHIKVLRAEEKVKEIENSLRKEKNIADLKTASAETLAAYGAKAAVSLILLIISIRNRHTPVLVFDDRINLAPLTGLLSFPTGISNAVSVPMWILSCNVTFNFVNQLFKLKK